MIAVGNLEQDWALNHLHARMRRAPEEISSPPPEADLPAPASQSFSSGCQEKLLVFNILP
jgi:hypothetical protein